MTDKKPVHNEEFSWTVHDFSKPKKAVEEVKMEWPKEPERPRRNVNLDEPISFDIDVFKKRSESEQLPKEEKAPEPPKMEEPKVSTEPSPEKKIQELEELTEKLRKQQNMERQAAAQSAMNSSRQEAAAEAREESLRKADPFFDFSHTNIAFQDLLDQEYVRLLPLVKGDNTQTLRNRHNQYLFRSVCHGLISYGRTNVLDEYLCLLVTNDITNAIDRGTVIQYMGDNYQVSAHNDFYLDDNPNLGEQAIRILCSSVEADLSANHSTYVEADLVSLLSLVQARMHTIPEELSYNLMPHCQKCLELLREYQRRPRSVISDKLLFYFQSVSDDLERYVSDSRFDAAFDLYSRLAKMKDTKRIQWLRYGIDDPESVAEHTINAWALAMIFLPTEYNEQNYNKQEILDMLLIHDMAEAIRGDNAGQLCEPTKELRRQDELLRKLFLKGTYPEVANMSHYYRMWEIYFAGQSINARIARDINLIQTVNTFYTYFCADIHKYTLDIVNQWKAESDKLSTNLGYELFDRIIRKNPMYRKATDRLITESQAVKL